MDADRWRRISRLFHEATLLPADERQAFLDRVCHGDDGLRVEVQSLLANDAGSRGVLASARPPLAPGDALGDYRIGRLLGRGGMGSVFLAHDTRLLRRVALKVIDDGGSGSSEAIVREARNAAALSHANICMVHEVGEAGGIAFIAMEFVDGRSLRERIDEGPLPMDLTLDYGVQAADALAHAHRHLVVHRDFKAANVLVTPGDHVKVVDFGLATRGNAAPEAVASSRQPAAGTPYILAPELVRGDPADSRVDVWALGVLLYEMAAGTAPFEASTAHELFASIVRDAPRPLPETVPDELRTIVERCLAKAPGERYQSADAVRDALRALQTRMQAVRRTGRRLAVLPLRNPGGADEGYFADGIHEGLITAFAQVRGLSVIARPSVLRYRGDAEVQTAVRELDADIVLTGSVTREDDQVRVSAQLFDAAGRHVLWASRIEGRLEDVLGIEREVVTAVARVLDVELTPLERARLERTRSVNPRAFDACLKGRFQLHTFSPAGVEKGLSLLYEALAVDPEEPLAHAGIAYAYSLMELFRPASVEDAARASAAAQRAIDLDDTQAEAYVSLAFFQGSKAWDNAAAERSIVRALELNPNLASAHIAYAQYLSIFGEPAHAVAEWQRGVELDPLSPLYRAWYAGALWEFGRFVESESEARRALELQPDFPVALIVLGLARLDQGALAEAVEIHQRARSLYPQQAFTWIFARTCALAGKVDMARRLMGALETGDPGDLTHPWFVAAAYAALGDFDSALTWLERAYEARILFMSNLARERAACATFHVLRGQPRYEALLRRLKLQ
jgi:TolB-like protein/Tfp pilus assembly protein PilF